ncbi:amino acid permease [Legionella septentrionalis]|nr:amino acid permease [Legionella septentrionalis]
MVFSSQTNNLILDITPSTKAKGKLIRALGLGAVVIYGVGDILGAGIYALVGKVAGHAGALTWLSFAVAMAIVLFTALSYGELVSRFPRSGGVSVYVQEAFAHKWLSLLVGLLLFTATILSMSTLSQAFVGYVRAIGFSIPVWLGIFIFLTILFLINIRGIQQSSIANMISTFIEISGLLIVLICGFWYLTSQPDKRVVVDSFPSIKELLQGAALAFFAFTGFEDLANIAEEVKDPKKNLPRAMLYSLGSAGILYLGVSFVATAIVPGAELSQSDSPLVDVVSKSYPAMPVFIFSVIAIFAVTNTTLLNYITASRLLYGMAEARLLPAFLQTVHPRYHTPYVAILFIFPIVFGLGLTGTLKGLAGSTSAIVLTVFSFSSAALIKTKFKEKKQQHRTPVFRVPFFIPCLAIALNAAAICFLPWDSIVMAAILLAVWLFLVGMFHWVYSKF